MPPSRDPPPTEREKEGDTPHSGRVAEESVRRHHVHVRAHVRDAGARAQRVRRIIPQPNLRIRGRVEPWRLGRRTPRGHVAVGVPRERRPPLFRKKKGSVARRRAPRGCRVVPLSGAADRSRRGRGRSGALGLQESSARWRVPTRPHIVKKRGPWLGRWDLRAAMERWPHGYRPTAGDLAHARFLQTAWYQLMRNGRSADLFFTSFRGTPTANPDGESRGLDRIGGWHRKGLGETRL